MLNSLGESPLVLQWASGKLLRRLLPIVFCISAFALFQGQIVEFPSTSTLLFQPNFPIFARMFSLSHLSALMGKELRLEWKQKYAISGLLLYSVSMVFVVGFAFQDGLSTGAWNIVFWIIQLFIAVNAVARSFMSESTGQSLYLYQLAGPVAVIAAKLIYNAFLMSVLTLITLFFYMALAQRQTLMDQQTGLPLSSDLLQFAFIGVLGSIGFAANLTLVSAIAAKARNSATLLAVLGFPLMIPQLIIGITAGQNALQGKEWAFSSGEMMFSGVYIILIASVSFILFPFVWKD